jgi:formiminotetrahydrofolate cyclodeaminase
MSYREWSLWNFLDEVASLKSVPAGGSVAAVTAAMAAALLAKMGRLALRQEGLSLSHDLVVQAESLRRSLTQLAYADAQAYQAAAKLSRTKQAGIEEVEAAWQHAVAVPLHIANDCLQILELAETLRLAGLAAADVQAVIVLAQACLQVQLLNADLNLSCVGDVAFRQASEETLASLRERLDGPVSLGS